MTASQLWREICRQNPEYECNGATLSPLGLRKLVLLCYATGRIAGHRDALLRADAAGHPTDMPPFLAELLRRSTP